MTDSTTTNLIAIFLDRIASCLEWMADDASDDRVKIQAKKIAMDAARFRHQLEEINDA